MVSEPTRSFFDLVQSLQVYPEEAFLFVREGLSFAAERVHGPESEAHRVIYQFLAEHHLDVADLHEKFRSGGLSDTVVRAVEAAGGWDKINRHVSGRDLCWALRDLALSRWGLLALMVLESWNIRETMDIGRIVFGFIEFNLMRKQAHDRIEDFRDVFSFAEAFEEAFRDGLPVSDIDNRDVINP